MLAIRSGKVPNYDPLDREINITMTKSKLERTRTAVNAAKQAKLKNFYRNQQRIHNANLSRRIDTFLNNIAKFNDVQEQ